MDNNIFFHVTDSFAMDFRDSRIDGWTALEHYHDAFEIAFFLMADIKIFISNKQYDIKPGDILFMKEYDIHKMLYSDHTQYTRYVINFKKEFIESTLKAIGVNDLFVKMQNREEKRFVTNLKQRAEFELVFKHLMNLYNKYINSNAPVIQAQIKLGLASLLIDLCRLPAVSSHQEETDTQQNLVRNIISYIDAGYMNEITLQQLEDNFHVSRFHICHKFKKTTGFTVVEYIQNRRIIEAQKMLESTSRDIIDICFACGFNNLQHFNRVFKKITGSTPHKYRKAKSKTGTRGQVQCPGLSNITSRI